MTLTLEQIKIKLPPEFSPVIDQFGPALLAMTIDELWNWIALALNGRADDAYRAVLAKMPNAGLLAEWNAVNAEWAAANQANAAAIAWQKEALMAVLKVCLAIALACLGF